MSTTYKLDFVNSIVSTDSLGTYEQWVGLLSNSGCEHFLSYYAHVHKVRNAHLKHLGFPILTKESMSQLADFIGKRKVADLGCGTGYLSAALKRFGVSIKAYDNFETSYVGTNLKHNRYCNIEQVDMHLVDLTQFDGVILSWPDYESNSAFRVANRLQAGQFLVYQGESSDGCTADAEFHSLIYSDIFTRQVDIEDAINDKHVRFYGINDSWQIFVKN